MAPGEEVYTTFMTYPSFFGATYPGYVPASGTSFSAPHVAGAVGLLAAVRPDLTDNDFQHVIRESAHDIGAPFPVDIDMGDLMGGMNAGIGPPGGVDGRALAREAEHGLFQHVLHRDALGLALPADEGRAVVFEGDAVARHG